MEFIKLLGCIDYLNKLWGVSAIISAIVFSCCFPMSLSLSLWYSHYAYVGALNGDPTFSEPLFIFLDFFLYSFFCLVKYDDYSSSSKVLHSSFLILYLFIVAFPFGSFFYFLCVSIFHLFRHVVHLPHTVL